MKFKDLDDFPKGEIFDDAIDISVVFKKSLIPHNKVLTDFETNENNAKIKKINIKDIEITQKFVRKNKVKGISNRYKYIPGVKYGNKIVIPDGHHRLTYEYLRGSKFINIKTVIPIKENKGISMKFDELYEKYLEEKPIKESVHKYEDLNVSKLELGDTVEDKDGKDMAKELGLLVLDSGYAKKDGNYLWINKKKFGEKTEVSIRISKEELKSIIKFFK
jgi:hypothetical protein